MTSFSAAGPGDENEAAAWRLPRLRPRYEMALAVALGAGSMVLIAWLARNTWFHVDVWDLLGNREIGSLDDLLRPRNGHWATPAVLQTRVLYGVAGMDFWPTHFLPRLVGWALLSFGVWRVLLRRGADRYVALSAYAVMLVLGTSWYLQAWFIGIMIVSACLLAAALLVEGRAEPEWHHVLLLFGLLLLSVMSAGAGVAVLAGTGLVMLLTRRWRWLIAVAAAALVYLAWFMHYHVSSEADLATSPGSLLAMPRQMFTVLQSALHKVLGLPESFGPVLAVMLILWLGYLALRGRLSVFDWVLLASITAFLGLVVMARANTLHDRYSNDLLPWLLPVVVPRLRIVARRGGYLAAGVVVAVILAGNLSRLENGIETRTAAVADSRAKVETAAALIGAGEPYVGAAVIDPSSPGLAKQLTADGLARLVDGGWRPEAVGAREEAARGTLRISLSEEPSEGRMPLAAPGLIDAQGCTQVGSGERLELVVTEGEAVLTIEAQRQTELRFGWQDQYGPGTYVSGDRRTSRSMYLSVVAPTGGATLRVQPGGGSVEVCGLTEG